LANNSFFKNAAFYDTSGIYIRAKTATTTNLNNIAYSVESDI
jgi:hypothetical protein